MIGGSKTGVDRGAWRTRTAWSTSVAARSADRFEPRAILIETQDEGARDHGP
jgi:hypothetical protein